MSEHTNEPADDLLPLFITAARNLESLLAEELQSLGIGSAIETRAGVKASASLEGAYRICLHSRVASRVLLPLRGFEAPTPDALYAGVREIDWRQHLGPHQTLAVQVDSARSQIAHTRFAAQRIKDAIVDQSRERSGARPSVDPTRPDLLIRCRLFRDHAQIYLDLSGEALHRRGWRVQGGAAPIKETLAAAVLLRAGWPAIAAQGGDLLDPLCGVGTLVIEGALIAADIAPGLLREHWGFLGWRGHDARLWESVLAEAKTRRADGLHRLARSGARLVGSDASSSAIKAAQTNAAHAGLSGHVQFERHSLEHARPPHPPAAAGQAAAVRLSHRTAAEEPTDALTITSETDGPEYAVSDADGHLVHAGSHTADEPVAPHAGMTATGCSSPDPAGDGSRQNADIPGLLVTNPPYGERIGAEDLQQLYQALGGLLRNRFTGWRAAVLTGNPNLGKRMGLRATRFHSLYNGPIECRLLHFDVRPEAHVSDRPRPLPATERGPGAEMLANRLRKNQKQLRRWLEREGIECYRLYDADLPEYALAVDLYHSADPATPDRRFVQVQEYAAPRGIDPKAARRRLREGLGVIAEVLEIPEQDLFFKVRRPQRGSAQYDRLNSTGHFHQVAENDLRFWVNFEDYLDTGLFLDHRPTRQLIGELAAGRDVLNLFAYTCTATCYAARGGARSTTSVDLSKTYLDWAQRNLRLNGLDDRRHRLIQADCLDWLERASNEQGADAPRAAAASGSTAQRHAQLNHRVKAPPGDARRYRPGERPFEGRRATPTGTGPRSESDRQVDRQVNRGQPQTPVRPFGLIFLDPPTFSTSKRMSGTFDVERDHVRLILSALRLLAPDGELIFSTNKRRFRLDQASLSDATPGLLITDISAGTIPKDFARNPNIHRCWRISRVTTPNRQ